MVYLPTKSHSRISRFFCCVYEAFSVGNRVLFELESNNSLGFLLDIFYLSRNENFMSSWNHLKMLFRILLKNYEVLSDQQICKS